MTGRERICAALDVPDPLAATKLAAQLAQHVGMLKVGLELFVAHGPKAVEAVRGFGLPIFLDLKLHDIPNTVAGGVRAVLRLRPRMLTVHASGGAAMIRAACDAAGGAGSGRPMILAVTVLTSLDQAALQSVGVAATPAEQVLRLGRLAVEAGADGLVCSPHEVAMLRQALGPGIRLVVPGIRPEGSAAGDQARTMTPAQAVAAGADWIVVGRPITGAGDPEAAAASIAASIR
jgi:orotidine-5'-phosphate decarboxylase